MSREYERQVESYWQHEFSLAYQERKQRVHDAYAANGGKQEPWMKWQVAPRDLPWVRP